MVRDRGTGELTLGRFGWKASKPTIREQSADAFVGDLGISNPDMPLAWGDLLVATLLSTTVFWWLEAGKFLSRHWRTN